MEKVKAKQVEGAVDTESKQDISGVKTFKAPLVIDRQNESFHMVNYEGFIYWTQDPSALEEEGNHRMGMVDGNLVTQSFTDGRWNTI